MVKNYRGLEDVAEKLLREIEVPKENLGYVMNTLGYTKGCLKVVSALMRMDIGESGHPRVRVEFDRLDTDGPSNILRMNVYYRPELFGNLSEFKACLFDNYVSPGIALEFEDEEGRMHYQNLSIDPCVMATFFKNESEK